MKERREYTKAFKESAVELIRSSGRPIKELAGELGICLENLRRWRREAEEAGEGPKKAFPGRGNARDEELTRLGKRVADLEESNEILKKAVAIFSPKIPR
jgi:transposase